MKDNPKQAGGPAMILYYAVDTDNPKSTKIHFMRIKIFTVRRREHCKFPTEDREHSQSGTGQLGKSGGAAYGGEKPLSFAAKNASGVLRMSV